MKKIGIIGGLSPESTVEYYSIICRGYNKIRGGVASPLISIESLDLEIISQYMKANDWDRVYEIILEAANNLKSIGAQLIIIATNTIHKIFTILQNALDVKMISIMDATAKKIVERGLKKVGLLGTIFTMQSDFYQNAFTKYNIEIITPSEEDQKYINSVIWKELTRNIISSTSKRGYLDVIKKLKEKGAEGVILGCTEIPLLIKQSDCDIPIFDTTEIHANAALDWIIENE